MNSTTTTQLTDQQAIAAAKYLNREQWNDPKFRTTKGELTPYALGCGYIQEYIPGFAFGTLEQVDRHVECVQMRKDGCYHINVWLGGTYKWLTVGNLRSARRIFNRYRVAMKHLETAAKMTSPIGNYRADTTTRIY